MFYYGKSILSKSESIYVQKRIYFRCGCIKEGRLAKNSRATDTMPTDAAAAPLPVRTSVEVYFEPSIVPYATGPCPKAPRASRTKPMHADAAACKKRLAF